MGTDHRRRDCDRLPRRDEQAGVAGKVAVAGDAAEVDAKIDSGNGDAGQAAFRPLQESANGVAAAAARVFSVTRHGA